ncbi:sensor histidine kinase [Paramicrobacterium agarici]|uniref:Sensor-like histidine kinase SenX3 n=1 Tax=Paramicrobacterium agarici TaxID=630514 RepID=A0A2A9DXQ8_9MICO|nr:ATP-binding protein [Microbacterium agarici]PFG30782.1 two-component system sensor histidine kinase SenX3 [Microbacterium agarici]
MDATWVVLLALVLGMSMGAGLSVFIFSAVKRGEQAQKVINPTVPDGVDQILGVLESIGIVLDASDNVLKASQGALALGIVRAERIVVPDVQTIADEVRRTGEPQTRRVTLEGARSGEITRILSVRAAPLGTRYVVVLANDLTESIRLDEVRRDFIANISHELKTPIGAISVLTEAIASAVDDPVQVRRFAEKMTTEADRLAALTADIINLSKLQANQALHMPELVRIDDVIDRAIESNAVVAGARNVVIARGEPSELTVYGEDPLLTMALQNLVSNAVQYSPDKSRVGVGARLVDDVVEISVTDQGVGIPKEDHDRVFERFYRLDGARSRNTGGTGLGLAIVKHTAQNHGGDVTVWSRPGQGSTFTLKLPVATGDDHVTPIPAARLERTQI